MDILDPGINLACLIIRVLNVQQRRLKVSESRQHARALRGIMLYSQLLAVFACISLRRHRYRAIKMAVAVVAILGSQPAFPVVIFEENFDGLLPTLGDSVNLRFGLGFDERVASEPNTSAIPNVWSGTGPTGWATDKNLSVYDGSPTTTPGVAGTGVANYGVDEWDGWNFAHKDFWSGVTGDQNRAMFGTTTNAAGNIAVAEADDYFDLGGTFDPVNGGYYSSSLQTASFSVTGGDSFAVGFDSSWRDEAFDDNAPGFVNANNQSIEIIASFDVGGDVQVVKWNSDNTDAFFKNDAPDENFAADGTGPSFVAPAGATSAKLSFSFANAANDWWWALDNIEVNDLTGGAGNVLFEDFEGVPLGDSINERIVRTGRVTVESSASLDIAGNQIPFDVVPNSFTHTPPPGWTVDNTGTPGVNGDDGFGVLEFEQWSFVVPDLWTYPGQDNGRQGFTNGTGVIAVADGDAWQDLGSPSSLGDLTTFMETPIILLPNGAPNILLEFDSSWRDEDLQTAVIFALLDGVVEEILHFNSDMLSPFYHPENLNESVSILFSTAAASTLQLRYSYIGNNDWWWAIDNIQVSAEAVPEPPTALLIVLGVCLLVGLRLHGRGPQGQVAYIGENQVPPS
jgi:hypothetical protein